MSLLVSQAVRVGRDQHSSFSLSVRRLEKNTQIRILFYAHYSTRPAV